MSRQRLNGALEAEALAALWAAGRPMTAAEVVSALGGELAHTTVHTVLTRLHRKGAVTREQVGRGHAYTPVLDEPGLAAQRMRVALDRSADHDAILTRFVATLSEEEHRTLNRLIARRHPEQSGKDR